MLRGPEFVISRSSNEGSRWISVGNPGFLYVKAVELPEGAGQPDQLSDKQVRQLLA